MLMLHSLDNITFNPDSSITVVDGKQQEWRFAKQQLLYIHSSKTELVIEFAGCLSDHRFTRVLS
jgi:hypothetical protein